MNATITDTFPPSRRLRRILPVVVASVAFAGAAAPAFAQDPPLSDYDTTSTSSTATPPPTPPPAATKEEAPAPAPKDDGGVKGDQAAGQPAPAAAPAAAPAPAGSTGRPAALAFTGSEPLIVGLLGAMMLMGAGVAYRRRQLN